MVCDVPVVCTLFGSFQESRKYRRKRGGEEKKIEENENEAERYVESKVQSQHDGVEIKTLSFLVPGPSRQTLV